MVLGDDFSSLRGRVNTVGYMETCRELPFSPRKIIGNLCLSP